MQTREARVEMAVSGHLRIWQIIIVLLLTTAAVRGEVIRVDKDSSTDYQNIQAGIDASSDGDVVLVAAGEYVITAPITFQGKAITLRSEAGLDETTIRMGTPTDSKRASVVIFENNETPASILQGFTITEGRGLWFDDPRPGYGGMVGGGILCMTASPTILDCTITQNSAYSSGGVGVEDGSSPTLTNCTISNNTVKGTGGGINCWDNNSHVTMTNCIIKGNSATGTRLYVEGHAGGVFCGGGAELTMINCEVSENSAGSAVGGVMCWQNGTLTMRHCVITDNSSQKSTGGIGAHEGSFVALTHCIVARNTAKTYSGGVKAATNSSLTVRNCTIFENSAGTYAGGVYVPNGSSATITNSIIRNNTAPSGPEIYLKGILAVTCSNVAGGEAGAYVGGSGTLDWGAGNIDVDPSFISRGYWEQDATARGASNGVWVEPDYHLKSQAGRWDPNTQSWIHDDMTSPCIDAGDPMSPINLEFFPNGGFVNMGAYGGTPEASKSYFGEPVCGTIVAGDINGDCQVDQTDLEIMALHWTDPEPMQP